MAARSNSGDRALLLDKFWGLEDLFLPSTLREVVPKMSRDRLVDPEGDRMLRLSSWLKRSLNGKTSHFCNNHYF